MSWQELCPLSQHQKDLFLKCIRANVASLSEGPGYFFLQDMLYLLTPSLFLPLNCRSHPLLFTGTPFDTSPSSFSLNILARPLLSQTLRMDFH